MRMVHVDLINHGFLGMATYSKLVRESVAMRSQCRIYLPRKAAITALLKTEKERVTKSKAPAYLNLLNGSVVMILDSQT